MISSGRLTFVTNQDTETIMAKIIAPAIAVLTGENFIAQYPVVQSIILVAKQPSSIIYLIQN